MEQIKLDVMAEIKKLDKSLASLKDGIKNTKLSKKNREEVIDELEEMIALLENAKH